MYSIFFISYLLMCIMLIKIMCKRFLLTNTKNTKKIHTKKYIGFQFTNNYYYNF